MNNTVAMGEVWGDEGGGSERTAAGEAMVEDKKRDMEETEEKKEECEGHGDEDWDDTADECRGLWCSVHGGPVVCMSN